MVSDTLKRCGGCSAEKPLGDFYKDKSKPGGISSQCKACTKRRTRQYRRENTDARRAYDRQYRKDNIEAKRESDRQYRESNKAKIAKLKRELYHKDIEVSRAAVRASYQKNRANRIAYIQNYEKLAQQTPEGRLKKRARTAVNHAIRSGVLSRPVDCEKCRQTCKPDAHHDNYNLPLLVRWLCRPCHKKIHQELELTKHNFFFWLTRQNA